MVSWNEKALKIQHQLMKNVAKWEIKVIRLLFGNFQVLSGLAE